MRFNTHAKPKITAITKTSEPSVAAKSKGEPPLAETSAAALAIPEVINSAAPIVDNQYRFSVISLIPFTNFV
ncbi:hypothetical protein JCM19240_6626 [Vibrio maritimus]|uniref:Uncharacterized protein n=1 Tax=Vibrio maritimus TaxID=990268 RepID=A0A090T382_9VIBR|nr:hypothetical protein JCM19240_6626 [Vibrio maritimus]